MKNNKKFLLVLLSILLVIAMTACSQEEADSEEEIQTKADDTVTTERVFAGGWPYETAPSGHFNMFLPNSIDLKFYRETFQLPLATYRAETDEYNSMLAEEWEISEEDESFNIRLRDGVKWHSGQNFTAKDVETTFLIYRLVGEPVWNYIEGVNVVNDNEVSFDLAEETSLLFNYILRKPMVDYETYGDYSDRVKELLEEGKDESHSSWEELANDFINFRPEMVNATGPYYLAEENISQSNIELHKNENSYLKDIVQFDKLVIYNGDVADLTPLVLNKEIDYLTHQFPNSAMESFLDIGYETIQSEGSDGIALYINQEVKPLDLLEVRQALAFIIDRDRVGDFALPGVTKGTKYLSGLGDSMTEEWADTSKLTDYGANLEKAEELLEEAGLSKENDKWFLEDGKEFTLSLQAPTSWSDAATAASEIVQQLTNFGIETRFDGIDSNSRQENINSGNFDLALSFFGTEKIHPAFGFETPLLVSNAKVSKGLGYSMDQDTNLAGQVNLEELIRLSTAGLDEELQKERIEKIIYTINETVPYIPIYTKWSANISSEGLRTDWGSDDGIYKNSAGDDNFAVIKILNGDLKPLTE